LVKHDLLASSFDVRERGSRETDLIGDLLLLETQLLASRCQASADNPVDLQISHGATESKFDPRVNTANNFVLNTNIT
jgi:hypothetical protein